jgi:hypothetical protein
VLGDYQITPIFRIFNLNSCTKGIENLETFLPCRGTIISRDQFVVLFISFVLVKYHPDVLFHSCQSRERRRRRRRRRGLTPTGFPENVFSNHPLFACASGTTASGVLGAVPKPIVGVASWDMVGV